MRTSCLSIQKDLSEILLQQFWDSPILLWIECQATWHDFPLGNASLKISILLSSSDPE
jgi:hypothetical protein